MDRDKARCLALGLALVGAACSGGEAATDAAPDMAPAGPTYDEPPPGVRSAWRFEHPLPQGSTLHAAWAGEGEAWAVGERGAVVRLGPDGAHREALGATGLALRAVLRVGATIWAAGDEGVVLRAEGGRWVALRAGRAALSALWAVDGAVFCAGQGGAQAYRFDGQGFVPEALPGWAADDAVRAAAAAGDDVYLAGSRGRILHRTRSGWFLEGDGLTPLDLSAVALAGGVAYAGGAGGRILRRDPQDGRWQLDHPRGGAVLTRSEVRALFTVPGPQGALYAATADGTVLRRDEAGWVVDAIALGRLRGGAGGAAGGYLVGDGGAVLRREGGGWAAPPGALRLTGAALQGLAVDGAVAYAVADDGTILRREGAPARWQLDPPAVAQPLAAVAARGGEALAAGMGGVLLRRMPQGWQQESYSWPDRRPDWKGLLLLGGGEAYAVGGAVTPEADAEAAILHRVGGAWSRERPAPRVTNTLYAVASDGRIVIAVGSQGTILLRSGPGVWQREDMDQASDVQLFAVVAHGGTFYAAGTGGAVLRREAATGRWTRVALPQAPTLTALASAGGDLWTAGGGGIVARRGGEAWTIESTLSVSHLSGLALLGTDLLAVGSGGAVLRRSLDTK